MALQAALIPLAKLAAPAMMAGARIAAPHLARMGATVGGRMTTGLAARGVSAAAAQAGRMGAARAAMAGPGGRMARRLVRKRMTTGFKMGPKYRDPETGKFMKDGAAGAADNIIPFPSTDDAPTGGGDTSKPTGGEVKPDTLPPGSNITQILMSIKQDTSKLVELVAGQAKKAYEEGLEGLKGGRGEGGGGKQKGMLSKIPNWKDITKAGLKIPIWLTAAAVAWGALKKAFEMLGTWIKEKITDPVKNFFINSYETVKNGIISAFNYLFGSKEGPDTLAYDIIQVAGKVRDWIKEKYDFTKELIITAWTDLTTWVKGVWLKIETWFTEKWIWAKDLIVTGWTDLTTYVKGKWDDIVTWFEGKWIWAKDLIVTGWADLTTYVSGKWQEVVDWFTKKWEWASDKVTGGWTSITAYVQGKWDSITGWFTKKWDGLTKWFEEFDPMATIKEKFGGMGDLVLGVAKAAWDWITSVFSFGGTEEKPDDKAAESDSIIAGLSEKLGKGFKMLGEGIRDIDQWISDQASRIMKIVAEPLRSWAKSVQDALTFDVWPIGEINFGAPISEAFFGLSNLLDPAGASMTGDGDGGITQREADAMNVGDVTGAAGPSTALANYTDMNKVDKEVELANQGKASGDNINVIKEGDVKQGDTHTTVKHEQVDIRQLFVSRGHLFAGAGQY